MANFKGHLAFGMATALAWSGIVAYLSILHPVFLPIIFIVTVLGSFLPDLDSDNGIPLRILLILTSVIAGFYVGYFSYQKFTDNSILNAGLYALGSALFNYFVLGGFFKKITVHRGMFHSIPAAVLSFLITLTILSFCINLFDRRLILSLSVGIGYLCHLILDELNSVVNLEGIPFIPNKSLGTALKFFSKNRLINILIYLLILILFIYNIPFK